MRLLTTSSLLVLLAAPDGIGVLAEQVGNQAGQAQGAATGRGQAPLPVPTNLVTPNIAGVVAAGTAFKVQMIAAGFTGRAK